MNNPERDQDRAADALDHFNRFGFVMFQQQVQVYKHLSGPCCNRRVLEAGCGMGLGTAILNRGGACIVGTDKLDRNVRFARCLYPWLHFEQWDITLRPYFQQQPTVVAIEVIEHVADAKTALRNLLASAIDEVWVSTPNGNGKPQTPENLCHVREYTPREIIEMEDTGEWHIIIRDWYSFDAVGVDTFIDPLVYQFARRR